MIVTDNVEMPPARTVDTNLVLDDPDDDDVEMLRTDIESTSLTINYTRNENYEKEKEMCINAYDSWSTVDQIDFLEDILLRMNHYQHGIINSFLKPILKRDFISLLAARGLEPVAEKILLYLDADSLRSSELVCREWHRVIADNMLWKKLIHRKVRNDELWKGLGERRGWIKSVCKPSDKSDHIYFRSLYPKIVEDIDRLESNWRCGKHGLLKIHCRSENIKGVYCLQYDDQKIVSGLRDNTIKLWDRKSLDCTQVLHGHTGSVLCLQYDDKIIVTGSSDATVRIWDVETGEMLNTLIHHCEAVLHLRFQDGVMITCSKDRSIAVWDLRSPTDINLKRVLVGHRAAVNVVDFDDKYIVSASGDRSIKVWNTDTCEYLRTLNGHRRGIACLQYKNTLVVSGSSDFSIREKELHKTLTSNIRLWDIEVGSCLRVMEGHEELVRCIRFDNKHIVSGAYDGKIKVWDLQAALDPRKPPNLLCIRTLTEHTGRVFRLQFDDFQIISSSHDDTILIWDFLDVPADSNTKQTPRSYAQFPPSP